MRFLIGRFETVWFFVGCKITNADKKLTLQIRQMAKQIGQNPRNPSINKGFGKFVKGRGEKWMPRLLIFKNMDKLQFIGDIIHELVVTNIGGYGVSP